MEHDSDFTNQSNDLDMLVKARVPRCEIQMLCKLVEGLGHIGVVTTLNKEAGEVLFQSTKDCWPDLLRAIQHMPFAVEFNVE